MIGGHYGGFVVLAVMYGKKEQNSEKAVGMPLKQRQQIPKDGDCQVGMDHISRIGAATSALSPLLGKKS